MKPNEIITALRQCEVNNPGTCRKCPVYNQSAGCLDLLHQEAAELIEVLTAERRWIPVTERLPDNSATVNLCTRSKIVGTGFYNKYTKSWVQYYSGGAICVDVTHWQPMPQPPKGE